VPNFDFSTFFGFRLTSLYRTDKLTGKMHSDDGPAQSGTPSLQKVGHQMATGNVMEVLPHLVKNWYLVKGYASWILITVC